MAFSSTFDGVVIVDETINFMVFNIVISTNAYAGLDGVSAPMVELSLEIRWYSLGVSAVQQGTILITQSVPCLPIIGHA